MQDKQDTEISKDGKDGKDEKGVELDDVSKKIFSVTQPVVQKINEIKLLSVSLKKISEEIQAPLPPDKKITEDKMSTIMTRFKLISVQTNKDIQAFTLQKDLMEEIRVNIIRKYSKMLSDAIKEYYDNLEEYKTFIKEKDVRLIRLHFGDKLSEAKIQDIVSNGSTSAYIQHSLSYDLSDTIAELESRHKGILKLERDIREVQELFVDLSVLVNVQSDYLDTIEYHIKKSVDYVEKGEKNLQSAERYHKEACKRQCCIVLIIMIILVVVIVPPIMSLVTF